MKFRIYSCEDTRLWEVYVVLSVLREIEGGIGQCQAIQLLREAGVPCRPGFSPIYGKSGIEVPVKFVKQAAEVLGQIHMR